MAELVKQYTKDDFLTTTEPYEEVNQYAGDPFREKREIELMSDRARLVGVRNFKALYKDYVSLVNQAKPVQPLEENKTEFIGQPMELNSGKWYANEDGIYTFNGWGAQIFACAHPIMPVERLVNVDSRVLKIKLAYRLDDTWQEIIVDNTVISSASTIISLASCGIAVTSENAKALVTYLHDVGRLNYREIPQTQSVTRLGWIPDYGFSPYIDNLTYDGEISFIKTFESVTEHGSYEKWLDLAKEIRSNGSVPARITLAASFASVLVGPIGALPFFVHVWGDTGTGKTVALMLAASVWANPEMGKFCKTFNSTAVAQERMAGFVNSLPLILDELQIQKGKDLDKTIYQLSEGAGKDRGRKNGGLQNVETWRNCILTTGEQPIVSSTSGGGAMNRIIELCCDDERLFKDAVKVTNTVRNNYGFAGRKFVEQLNDEIFELARETFEDYSVKFRENATEKQAMAGAMVLVADEIATSLIFKDGNGLKQKDIAPYLLNKHEVDVNRRAFEWFKGWLQQNNIKFDSSDFNADVWGRKVGNEVRIFPHIFENACITEGYNPKAFARWLCNHNLLATARDGNLRKPCYFNGKKTIRCYVYLDKE